MAVKGPMNHIESKAGIFLLTVDTLENYEVVEYYGIVVGQAIYGANFVKDFFAKVSDTLGGRVTGYEKALEGAIEQSLLEMAQSAKKSGANAIMGIDIKTNSIGKMLLASCAGTAVKINQRSTGQP